MSEVSSARTYRTTSAVGIWWRAGTGHHRTNSDTTSVVSRGTSNQGKTRNRLSVPSVISQDLSYQRDLPAYAPSRSYTNVDDPHVRFPVEDTNESAVSDTSAEDTVVAPRQHTANMGDRTMPTADRTHTSTESRGERVRRVARPSDPAPNASSSTLSTEPSLFDACHELQRRNVRITLSSIQSLGSIPAAAATTNTANRAALPRNDTSAYQSNAAGDRHPSTSCLEHLLALPPEPSYKDLCLNTALKAGATVEFLPRSSQQSIAASETFTCEDCEQKCRTEQEWETHIRPNKSACPICDVKFECHGLLLRHGCYNRT